MKPSIYLHRVASVLLLSSSFIISGCSREDAKALKNTASLFRNASIAAIDSTENMILRETQEPAQTDEEIKASFIRVVLSQEISDPILAANLEHILVPPQPSAVKMARLKTYLASLREQYRTLAAIYDDLERGHLLANEAIQKSKPPLEKLTVQMVYLAVCIDRHPANLVKDKSKVLAEIIRSRRTYFKTDDLVVKKDMENKLYNQLLQWQRIEKDEQELTQDIIKHSITAAMLGRELRERINRYREINLESLNSLLINTLDIVSTVGNQDDRGLKKQVNQIYEAIKNDEDFREGMGFILDQFNPKSESGGSSETVFSPNECSALMQTQEPESNSSLPVFPIK